MLRAGAEPDQKQHRDQRPEAAGEQRKTIRKSRKRRAARQHQRRADPLAQQAGGDLEARHRAGEHAAQRADRRIAQAELRLPDRQHDDHEVGVAVVQRMRAAGDTHRAPLFAARAFRGRAIGGGAHAAPGRRSTKPEPMNESTCSPF